jgi:hypothetical protein
MEYFVDDYLNELYNEVDILEKVGGEKVGKYSDDEIRSCKKITLKIAADYLGISPLAVGLGMRNDLLPIGFAIKHEDRYSESWGYHIIDERLIAYKHGKITNVQVQNIEKNLETIIFKFEEMKKDLLFILSESAE